jgi:hypothetical protein
MKNRIKKDIEKFKKGNEKIKERAYKDVERFKKDWKDESSDGEEE